MPQAWFLHFYVVGAVFNLLLLVSYALQYYLRLDPDAPQLLVVSSTPTSQEELLPPSMPILLRFELAAMQGQHDSTSPCKLGLCSHPSTANAWTSSPSE